MLQEFRVGNDYIPAKGWIQTSSHKALNLKDEQDFARSSRGIHQMHKGQCG